MKDTNVDFCVWTPRLFNSVCHHNVLWPNLPSMLYAAVTIDIDFEEKTSISPCLIEMQNTSVAVPENLLIFFLPQW